MEIIKPDLEKAIVAIGEGKILICPTDTVYGLICDANNKKAVGRLYKIKKRPKNKPIPLFVYNIEMAKKVADISSGQEKFLKKVWPGATTCVLTAKGGGGSIGIRMPDNKFVLDLVKHNKWPLAETSANISGKQASVKIREVLAQFTLRRGSGQEDQPDLVIDNGDLPASKPSKVVDLRFSPPKILRI